MLYRLVRSVKRSDSSLVQFVKRIPDDVLPRVANLKLSIPLGDGEFHHIIISPKAQAIRFSLRTRDPGLAKSRQAHALAFLEEVWRSLRATKPVSLTNKQAHALAGELYRAWASEPPTSRSIGITLKPGRKGQDPNDWVLERGVFPQEEAGGFHAIVAKLNAMHANPEPSEMEPVVGPLVARLLLVRGIAAVETGSRLLLLAAFVQALRDAFENRARNAEGDYSPDPKSQRFPQWVAPQVQSKAVPAPAPAATVSLKGLVEDWWKEAEKTGTKRVTYVNYRNVVLKFAGFLEHDDAAKVGPDDVLRYKDHRLASVYAKTGKPISPKTVKDTDFAALKTVLGWAKANKRLPINAAEGLTLKLSKKVQLRGKSQRDDETAALLSAALTYESATKARHTVAATQWVPWLCAYTGARIGEMAQLRKQDLRREGESWVIRITPEAGTVKSNEARDVVVHEHLVEVGFVAFVDASPPGHLFFTPGRDGDVTMQITGLRNRLAQFARKHIKDLNVAPYHGLRHRFKEVGIEAGIEGRVLDAIQGHAPQTVAGQYGRVTIKTQALAMAKFPRVKLEG
jgi:integrase